MSSSFESSVAASLFGSLVLLIRYWLKPIHSDAIEVVLYRDVRHGRIRICTMPVLHVRWNMHNVTGMYLLHETAFHLHSSCARGDKRRRDAYARHCGPPAQT
jgi:hypothetical protein